MTLYYPVDIETAIERVVEAGGDVTRKSHAIYASPTASFTNDRYPLEIIVTDRLPEGTDIIIGKKEGLSEPRPTTQDSNQG